MGVGGGGRPGGVKERAELEEEMGGVCRGREEKYTQRDEKNQHLVEVSLPTYLPT